LDSFGKIFVIGKSTIVKSFQSWGLKEVDENADKELGEFLTQNWNDVFLKSLDKPGGQGVGN